MAMKPKLPPLLLRADADAIQGTGHVMRCLALSAAWQSQGGSAVFISRCDSAAMRQRILASGAEFIPLTANQSLAADSENTLVQLAQRQDALLVLDGYHFDFDQQVRLRQGGHPLLVVDDTAHLDRYHADVLLNQNLGAAALDYRCDPEPMRLFGPVYAMLRPEFAQWRDHLRGAPAVARKILVTLGGSDPGNFTARAVEALAQLETPELAVRVVVGPANPYFAELKAQAARFAPRITLLGPVADMGQLMTWADLAVSACGTTSWELACLGLPAVTVIMAENQRGIGEQLDALKVVENLGWHGDISANRLAGAVQVLQHAGDRRARMSERGRALVDGQGAQRVAQALHELSCRKAA